MDPIGKSRLSPARLSPASSSPAPETEESLPYGAQVEIARGVRVERRSFLELAAFGICSGFLPVPRPWLLGGLQRSDVAELTFEEFLAQAVPVARELGKEISRIGEDRYLLLLASYAVRLRDVPVPELRDNTAYAGAAARTWIGANEIGGTGTAPDPFTVLHWRMDPGAEIGQHAHTYGNVVTLGLAGEARIRNYEMVDTRDFRAKGPFPVRKVVDQVLRPGGVNFVPLEHGYTHGFVAGPEGARGLDITTRTRPKEPSPILELSDLPLDEERGIYEGTWIYR